MGLSVPTPSGVLAGMAGFSWDGTAWQPSDRAMFSVGIPSGVLDGLALFNWDGTNWQPSGRAMPDIATPTGVLDGAAVYTWTGTAWAPLGGVPTVPTPTGGLRGIAAFSWDGTNWQPTGQARPYIATPSGVLQGVALYGWTGSAWAPSLGLPSLDLAFANTATLDPRISFTRASTATDGTYLDAPGSTYNTYAVNQPRLTPKGFWIEGQRTNFLLNSNAPATQTTGSLPVGLYTLWVIGTGSAAISAGTAVATGYGTATAGNPVTINITTAGTVVVTVSGTLTRFQLGDGPSPSSYIPTAGATVTRSPDQASMPTAGWYSSAQGTVVADYFVNQVAQSGTQEGIVRIDDGTVNNMILIVLTTTTPTLGYGESSGANVLNAAPGTITLGNLNKAGVCYGPQWIAANNSIAQSGGSGSPVGINRLVIGDSNAFGWPLNGWLRRVRYYPRQMSATELQQVTT